MQNKGFVMTFAVLLAVVCCYYLSFSVITRNYDDKAAEYAQAYAEGLSNGDAKLYTKLYDKQYSSYLDSMATERVGLNFSFRGTDYGYTLKECREREIGLGLDLKGGMSVIVEVDAAAVVRSLGNVDNEAFLEALSAASAASKQAGSKDFISLFANEYKAKNGTDKLAGVFSAKLSDQINPQDADSHVIEVLRKELQSIADNSFNVLRTRIDRFGVVAPNIQKLEDKAERILIELPGVKEPERVRKLLQGSANLEFWKTYDVNEISGYLASVESASRAELALQEADSTNTTKLAFQKSFWSNFVAQGGGSIVGVVNKSDTAAVGAILAKYKDEYPSDLKFAWGFKAIDLKETQYYLYALRGDGIKKGPALDGEVVISASADQSRNSAAWEVDMQMNSKGAQEWAAITGAEKGRSIAIVLDGHVYSAPNVQNKIEGGRSQVTGNFTVSEAKDLENVLKSGKMKAGVHIVQEDVIGPSLGEESINAGMLSFLIAIIILFAYMCIVYGFVPGMVANTALLFNLFFTMGVLASMRAALTLPGITGLVLTLGMAVDANVLIYERTKEELRGGKTVRTALADGYKHAFSAIFDSNVTTLLTAIILAYFGTGAIQGFATTLMIGITVSFFTAVFMTRLFYDFMMNRGKFQKLTFTTALTKNLFVDTKINFLGKANKAYILSGLLFVAGIVSLFTLGLNKGIDFTGGRNYVVRFDKTVNTQDVESALSPLFGEATLRVLTTGTASQNAVASQVRITTNYKVEDARDEVEAEVKGLLAQGLGQFMDEGKSIDHYIKSSQRVGPSIADDLKKAATIAVTLAIIMMAAYILLRFRDIAFSIGTFIAVAHDSILVILLYSLLYKIMPFSMEIDQTFIAAILTVIGYSINDKVVIFDRIRETRHLFPKRDVTLTVNDALNSTLGRTINTSLSVLVVILCIFLLGGDNIRSFTFAIFMGVLIGTYSSIFIATPIAWSVLKKKQDKAVTSK